MHMSLRLFDKQSIKQEVRLDFFWQLVRIEYNNKFWKNDSDYCHRNLTSTYLVRF